MITIRFLSCIIFSEVHLLFNFKEQEYYKHHMMTERISLSIKLRISLSVEIATVWGDVRLGTMQRDLQTWQEREIIIAVSL